MVVALEINFALWIMIGCAAVRVTQLVQYLNMDSEPPRKGNCNARLPQAAAFISAGKPPKSAAALEAALPQTNLHLGVVEREIETWGQQLKGSRSAVPIPVRENLLQEWSILYR